MNFHEYFYFSYSPAVAFFWLRTALFPRCKYLTFSQNYASINLTQKNRAMTCPQQNQTKVD